MLLVPEGAFVMGSDEGYPHERPAHEVFLSAFYIDELEVTNLFYGACVEAGACEPPVLVDSPSQIAYYGSEYYYDFPVIYVTWGEAQAYCRWRGGHLPLEAQWEKAARWDPGSGESRQFPWIPPVLDPYYLNYASVLGRTTVVGSYPAGISPIGALDMAGNVSEWVYDWYQDNYYEQSPYDNPRGPLQGEFKVFRGGSYEAQGNGVTTTFRDYTGPATRLPTVGFRCAWTPSGDPTGP
jgi:formylglycine-generating enzyme required for sulfatase activity